MTRLLAIAGLVVFASATSTHAQTVQVKSATTDVRKTVTLELQNPGAAAATYPVPAGAIFQTAAGQKAAVLRASRTELAPGASAELAVPVAELSSAPFASAATPVPTRLVAVTEPRLEPLLSYLAQKSDIPRATSQCAVFALLEDVSYPQWQQWVATGATPDSAAKALEESLVTALDAIAILREVAPGKSFRLQTDEDLKLRALRQPGLRAKAMLLFGVNLPGDAPATPAQPPPTVGQLLHTKPGDDCPICRMRAQMQRASSDL